MSLPNFLVIGAPKAGTTSMCAYLTQHPDIFVSEPKELHFFCDERLYARGVEWYRQQFAEGAESPLRGEGTPFYSMSRTFPNVLPRLREVLPELKLIYMVRHPLARMESYYSQEINNGWDIPAFTRAVSERPHYVDASRYHEQWSLLADAYGEENVLVLFFEEFIKDPRAGLDAAMEFLGADRAAWSGSLDRVNGRDGHLEDTVFMRLARRVPGFSFIERHRASLMPQSTRSWMKATLRRRPTSLPHWDEETMQWAIDQVRDDAAAFLARHGMPADYWGDLSRSADGPGVGATDVQANG